VERNVLHWAAALGHADVCAVLIAHGCPINAIELPAANSPLHLACAEGHLDCVVLLLDEGAAPAPVNEDGLSPIHVAAARGHADILLALLQTDAPRGEIDVRSRSADGSTACHYAACGHPEALRVLIFRGAQPPGLDLNALNNDGSTPAHMAAITGSSDCLALLAEAGADLARADAAGATPLHAALSAGYAEDSDVIKKLVSFRGGWRRAGAGFAPDKDFGAVNGGVQGPRTPPSASGEGGTRPGRRERPLPKGPRPRPRPPQILVPPRPPAPPDP
jgi:ankyrin repeat protein